MAEISKSEASFLMNKSNIICTDSAAIAKRRIFRGAMRDRDRKKVKEFICCQLFAGRVGAGAKYVCYVGE